MTASSSTGGFPADELEELRREAASLRAALAAEQQRAAQGLKDLTRTRMLLEAVVEQCPIPMVVVSAPELVVEYTNRAAMEILGLASRGHRGAALHEILREKSWQDCWPDGTQIPASELPLARALRGEVIDGEELMVIREDGSRRWESVSGAPIFDADGKLMAGMIAFPDITARKLAEAETAAIQQRLNLALEGANLGTWDWDIPTGVVHYDQRWADMLGYRLSDLEPSLMAWKKLVHPEDFDRAVQLLKRHLAGETEWYEFEHRLRRRDGSWIWVLSKGRVVTRDAQGNPLRATGTHLDVTQRKLEEQHLRTLANEQRTVLNTVTTGIVFVRGRCIQWANAAFARMVGYELGELEGVESERIYFDRADWQVVGKDGYTCIARGEVYAAEICFKRKDGQPIWCELSGQAVEPRDPSQGSIWAFRDVTKERHAEQALRESERRFERLVQNSIDIIAVTDDTCTISSISASVQRVLGYDPGRLIGSCAFEIVHPDDLATVQVTFGEMLAHPGAPRRVEYRHLHASGTWVPCEAVGTNLLEDPSVKGMVFNVRDISERRNAELEHGKLTAQLQQAMKMEAVGRLAGGIAHDFNNLLTAILGNIELAGLEFDATHPVAGLLGEATKAAQSAASLTRRLLAFSRKQIIEPKPLNLNALVENLRELLGRIIGEDIYMRLHLATELATVKIDPGQFEQVLVNLAVNARDAMPNGGQLVIETANVELDENYSRTHSEAAPGKYVLLSISDTGVGMDAAVKERLFEPFFTTKPKGLGTGLGLATTFGVVKQAGGCIDVYSEPGIGATFKIYLPRIEEQAQPLSVRAQVPVLQTGHETILLVEDETSVRTFARAVLTRLGYSVLCAKDAYEALEMAEGHSAPIAVLLTDVVMPGMNGKELAERMALVHPEAKTLYASGYTENVVVHRGVVDEGTNFIGKPYAVEVLATKLREILD